MAELAHAPTAIRLQGARTSLTVAAVALSVAALLLPSLLATVPPLVDYPNHLARLWLLAGGAAEPGLLGYYRVGWDTWTNVGMDLVGSAMAHVLPFEQAGRILVAAGCLFAPLGGVLLWRQAHGGWHWWQLSFPLLAWNMGLVFGFLNFTLGIGLALLFVAAEPALARLHPALRAAVRLAFGCVLLLTHIFSLPLYAALLGGLALGPGFAGMLRPDRRLPLLRELAGIGGVVAAPLVLLLLAPSRPGAQAGASAGSLAWEFLRGFAAVLHDPLGKLQELFAGVLAYDARVDVLTALVLLAPVAVALLVRRVAVHAGLLVAGLGLAGLFFVFPHSLAGTAYIDLRFALMAPFALAAALRPELPYAAARYAAAALLLATFVRTGTVAWTWSQRQADVDAMARALEPVPRGAAVLPLQHRLARVAEGRAGRYLLNGMPVFSHLPALAVPWAGAFVPTLFAARGKQPLQVLPPWSALSEPEGGMLAGLHVLDDPALLAASLRYDGFLDRWRQFDYVLVVNADVPDLGGPFRLPAALQLVRDEGFAVLYRIRHDR